MDDETKHATSNAPPPDAMAQFLAHFDPLAMLDAEYAAVLAQSIPRSSSGDDSQHGDAHANRDTNDNDSNGANDDDDSSDDVYEHVPASPTGDREYYQPLGDDSDDDDAQDDCDDTSAAASTPANAAASTTTTAAQSHPQLDAATRTAVMQSMRQMTLQPPPSWATNTNLSDDDLVAMVLKQR